MKIRKSFWKIFLYFFGLLFLVLGILGIFIPLLPTTPFLLLAATAFMHTDRKIYIWMFRNQFFGKQLSAYVKDKSVSLSLKISSLMFLSLTLGYSIIFVIDVLWLRIFLTFVGISVAIHIIKLKTLDNHE